MMNDLFTHAHFLRPWILLLIPLLLALLYLLKQRQAHWGSWQQVCSPELLHYLRGDTPMQTASQRPLWLIAIAGLCIILALAGPVWKKLPQPLYQPDSALVILLDLSRSMDAQDVKPSRLARAKQKLTDLLHLRQEGQTGLVVFAGSAHSVTPLTDDNATILSQLQELSTDIMPKQGGNIDTALSQALQLLKQSSIQHGNLLLITDSEQYSDAVVMQVTAAGHRLDVIGIGTKQGAPIPQAGGGFVSDMQGNMIIPQLHAERLKQLATQGHGSYRPLSLNQDDLVPIRSHLSSPHWGETAFQTTQTTHDMWYEEGPWLLLLVLPLALLAFRRGILVIACCSLLLPIKPAHADASESIWSDLWQSKNSQGEALMAEKKYNQAAKTFDNPAWRAAAHYRDQDYAAATQDFAAITHPTSDDIYNQANALAHLGKLDEAIAAYDDVLKKSPEWMDAKANKALLEKLKKEQQEKNSSQQQNQQHDKQQGNQQKHSDQQKESQNGAQKSDQKGDKASQSQPSPQQQSDQAQNSPSEHQDEKKNTPEKQPAEATQTEDKKQASEKDRSQPHALSEAELKQLESQQAFDQSMRRVPDDPGGLLRRKFLYQYQQHAAEQAPQQGVTSW